MKIFRRRGFTLVELLIVIVIIGVLASIAAPVVTNASRRAKESAVRDHLNKLRKAVSYFREDTDRYPANLTDLAAASAPAQGYSSGGQMLPIKPEKYYGPYIDGQAIPTDMIGWVSYDGAAKGRVWCPVSGTDLNGNLFSSY